MLRDTLDQLQSATSQCAAVLQTYEEDIQRGNVVRVYSRTQDQGNVGTVSDCVPAEEDSGVDIDQLLDTTADCAWQKDFENRFFRTFGARKAT